MTQSVGNKVQEYRSSKNITQEELGLAVGVTRQTIIAIERGNYTPSVHLALRLAKYFKTSVEKLFVIED